MQTDTFAARAGRWSARHRKKAIFGWLAFVVVAFVIGGAIGTKKPNGNDNTGQSAKAENIFNDHFPDKAQESVLIQAPRGGSASDAAVHKAVAAVIAAVNGKPGVQNIDSPYAKGNGGQISKDGRSVLVKFEIRGDSQKTEKLVAPIEASVKSAAAANPGVSVGEFGDASANKAISKSFQDDFKKAETLSIPITLVILVLAFGALVAAGVPLLLGLTAVLATLGLVAIPSQIIPMDNTVSSVILLIGMAVGVDYTLFYLRREREEKRRGASKIEAVHTAAATSGRAILVSGFTVMAAMAGMFLAGDKTFFSLGVGAIMVVGIAMIGSVTVVPAMLAWLGDRVNKGRVPLLHRVLHRPGREEGRFWNAVLTPVLRYPWVAAGGAVAVLVALAIPALSLHLVQTGTKDLPRKLEVMRVYDRMQAAFPGGQIPAVVAIKADDVKAPAVQRGIAEMERQALATGRMNAPITVSYSADGQAAAIDIPVKGSGTDNASMAALAALRNDVIPHSIGKVDGVQAYVTGMTAGTKDFNDLMRSRAPLVFAFVLTLAFLLLLVTFRSIVIPIKAIVLNLLSVAAAYGVLVWVFQQGHLQGLLGFHSDGGVVAWLPLFLFVILFGLSMDYHVFILSRIREAVDRGMRTDQAVAYGIQATAGTVTSAAVVMVAVFAIFATLSALDFKQMGVGLAVAILIDATIVRAVLLPASMKLLGKWNWYLPRSLEWLPKVSHHGERPVAEPARA